MFILEETIGKKVVAVGVAGTEEEAKRKIALAAENGSHITARQIIEKTELFKERDYTADVKALSDALIETANKIKYFPFDKVGEEVARQLLSTVVNNFDEDLIERIAHHHRLYVYLGDYGYGRTLEWQASNGNYTATWVSSSQSC